MEAFVRDTTVAGESVELVDNKHVKLPVWGIVQHPIELRSLSDVVGTGGAALVHVLGGDVVAVVGGVLSAGTKLSTDAVALHLLFAAYAGIDGCPEGLARELGSI